MNFDLKIREITLETFLLTGKIDNKYIINNLINFIRDNKNEELSYKTFVKGHFTGFKSLIRNKDFINFLKIIQSQIKFIHKDNFEIFDAWGNICKYGEEVVEHDHRRVTAFSGILYLSEGGPGTYFKDYDLTVNEEIGKYVLFHPKLLHKVNKIEKDIERISLAFNMNRFPGQYLSDNIEWVNKNDI
jgi:hypothetical protein